MEFDIRTLSIITNTDMLRIQGYSYNVSTIYWDDQVLIAQSSQVELNETYGLVSNLDSLKPINVDLIAPYNAMCTVKDIWQDVVSYNISRVTVQVALYETTVVIFSQCVSSGDRQGESRVTASIHSRTDVVAHV